ncbi:MAG: hypothetical protein U0228_38565 [Myxococcaceae bacterium]
MNSRVVVPVVATVGLGLVVAVLVDSIFNRGGGAEGAIITHLKEREASGLEIATRTGVLKSDKASFQRISVVIDADGQGALVSSTLDFVGRFERVGSPPRVTKVSSLGLETARFVNHDGTWSPAVMPANGGEPASEAPRLAAIVDALEGRRQAIEGGASVEADGGIPFPDVALPRSYRAESWFIRSERAEVEVAEDSRLEGRSPDRPVDEKRTTRLSLEPDTSGSFRFPGGTM